MQMKSKAVRKAQLPEDGIACLMDRDAQRRPCFFCDARPWNHHALRLAHGVPPRKTDVAAIVLFQKILWAVIRNVSKSVYGWLVLIPLPVCCRRKVSRTGGLLMRGAYTPSSGDAVSAEAAFRFLSKLSVSRVNSKSNSMGKASMHWVMTSGGVSTAARMKITRMT